MIFNRSLTSASSVYREYENGLDGCLSVKEMNTKYKAKWRASNQDRTFYQRRKVIYECIAKIACIKQLDPMIAAKELDKYKDQNKRSLDWITKHPAEALGWIGID